MTTQKKAQSSMEGPATSCHSLHSDLAVLASAGRVWPDPHLPPSTSIHTLVRGRVGLLTAGSSLRTVPGAACTHESVQTRPRVLSSGQLAHPPPHSAGSQCSPPTALSSPSLGGYPRWGRGAA